MLLQVVPWKAYQMELSTTQLWLDRCLSTDPMTQHSGVHVL